MEFTTVSQELINRKKENGTFLAPQQKLSQDLAQLRNDPDFAEKSSCLLQKFPTFEDFAIANSPSRQIALCHDPEGCVYGDSPTLKLLDITYGRFASAIWLVPQIADVSVCCGLKEDASEDQIKLVAAAIASKYQYLKTDELLLFFFNFKAGFYEQFFSYFDPQAIVRSVKSFCDKRNTIMIVHERELQQKINEQNAPSRK